ncbi:MAG: UDP-galactopyranose mutase [Candidatus Saccharibacteria bacterium]|nr:UDP-galactopyranose mutase [Candidatus Saccharibacteria bacterium]
MEIRDYKYIVVGAGLFGATVAEHLARKNKVLVIEKRDHIAGNIYSHFDEETGIEVHDYGSHIFHTEFPAVYDYLTKFTEFNNYIHTVDTRHNGKLYPMPINLNTINFLYGTNFGPEEAEKFIKSEAEKTGIKDPKNFEEKGLSLVGEKLYTAFLKNYTRKQWNTDPKNLDAAILSRIPVRYSTDNRYFITAKYQGIPKDGYTKMVENMLSSENITTKLNTTFKDIENQVSDTATIIYTGQVDELLDYKFGPLPYRSLRFEEKRVENSDQKEAVINEADLDVPYTRTHDYKYYQIHHPEIINQPVSILCHEYPADFEQGGEAYYPVNNEESEALYQKYLEEVKNTYKNLILGGRLGAYLYWDMDLCVKNALDLCEKMGYN